MSQHKRNVDGMQNAIRQKSERATSRVQQVIQDMLDNNQAITFNHVANLANVSKGWLYSRHDICDQIKKLRSRNQSGIRAISPSSLLNRDSIISTLRDRLAKLESENKELRKQLEIVYGQLHMKPK